MTQMPKGMDLEGFLSRLHRDILELWTTHLQPYPLRLLAGRVRRGQAASELFDWIMENHQKFGYTIVMSRQAGRYIFMTEQWEKMTELDRNKFYRLGRRFYLLSKPNPSDLRRAEIVLANKITEQDSKNPEYEQFIKPHVKEAIAIAEKAERDAERDKETPSGPIKFF